MKAAFLFLLVLIAVVLAGGCNFAPPYRPPLMQTPVAYKETNNWKMAQPSDNMIKGKWWEMFNDPQLNALEEQVNISNQTIVASLQNFLAARALVKEARAAYFPTVSAVPTVTASKTGSTSGNTVLTTSGGSNAVGSSSGRVYSDYSLPLDASWEPDLWGSIANTVRGDAYAAQASAAALENMRLTEQSEVALDFYELRGQDELIQLYADTVKSYQESIDLTKTLFETGIDSELDVVQADTLLETTLATSTGLGVQRGQLEHAIALLVGQPASTFSLNPAPIATPVPAVLIGLPSQLLERRPDVASAERTVAEENAAIGVARATYFPTISLSGSTGFQSTSISQLLTPSSFFWSVGASVAETIFDAGRRKALNQQAWATYRSTVATYRETVLTAFQQVEDALVALRILGAEIKQQQIAVAASQKNVELSMERYRLGITSYLNVITAQETLLGNQQTAVNLRMQQYTYTVQLIMALGGGWNTNNLPNPTKLASKPAVGS
jgi:NodT family efflux transporter outer membrane factor (OMF) lipoprotein